MDENNAFIEFLSSTEDIEILDNITVTEHQIKNDMVVINIPRT